MKKITVFPLAVAMAWLPFSAFASDLDQGKLVYEGTCAMCHKSGIAGAPKLGDKADWKDRIAKGDDMLVKNSIDGFKGSTGYMPPKGGKSTLTDEEVSNAVHYMISQAE